MQLPAAWFSKWLLQVSWQGAVLVLLVLLIQWALGKRLSARSRYALWFVVLLRLILPAVPQGPWSIHKYTTPTMLTQVPAPIRAEPEMIPPEPNSLDAPNAALSSPPSAPVVQSSPSAAPSPSVAIASKETPPQRQPQGLSKPDILRYCTTIWLCGVTLLTLRVVIQNIVFSRRAANAQEIAEPEILNLLQQSKAKFRLSSAVMLLETDLVKSPALYGLFRPRLLLPLGLAHSFNAQELRCIFLHELAHLKRRDVMLQWLVTILQILHWFNPVLWYGLRRMASDREMACDELALSSAGNIEAACYAETIIKVLENCSRPQTLPGLVGILESKEQMTRRISRIAAFRRSPRWSLSAALLLAALALVGLTGAQTRKPQPAPKPTPSSKPTQNPAQPTPSQMNFIVLDAETGKPLPGTKVRVSYFGARGSKGEKLLTGDDGAVLVPVPQAPYKSANLFATARGYVPISISLRTSQEWPAEYTLKMKRGKTITGFVQDATGQPIEGVKIHFPGPGLDLAKFENIQFGLDSELVTDAAGRWVFDMVPKEFESIAVNAHHPQFTSTYTNLPATSPAAGAPIIVMHPGTSISGTVTDLNGQPVSDATIREVLSRFSYRQTTATAKTDGQGDFELQHLPPGDLLLAVQADGFAPQVLKTNVTEEKINLAFRLEPGRILRVRVTDEAGNPLPNATARTDSDNQGLREFEWSTKTDADGRVEWDSAPDKPVLCWFALEGRFAARSVLLKADGTEHIVMLSQPVPQPVIQVNGTVLDADTGQPLEVFDVLKRDHVNPTFPEKFRRGTRGRNGKFALDIEYDSRSGVVQLQIQSEGYLPVASTTLYSSNGTQNVEFKLRKGSGPSGTVISAENVPVAGAIVFMCERSAGVYMEKPGESRKGVSYAERTATDANGHFSFQPRLETTGFIVLHEQGYAELSLADLKASGKIQLQPWGRIEGRLYFDNQPAPNETVSLENVRYRYPDDKRDFPLNLWYKATTDAQGNFAFDKVPPGYRRISHRLNTPFSNSIHSTQPTTVWVEPGKVTSVLIGGQGRPIIGKASINNPPQDLDWRNTRADLTLKFAVAPVPPQTRLKQSNFPSTEAFLAALQQEASAYKAFWTSEAGREIERNQKSYSTILNADGSFAFQDIPAGTYELKLEVKDLNPNNVRPGQSFFSLPDRAALTNEVIVPPIPGGRTDQPLDLGVLELKKRNDR